jgi:Domain of unknown function (DUF4352)
MRNKEKKKKSLLKRWWVWVIAVVVLIGIFAPKDDKDKSTSANSNNTANDTNKESKDKKEDEKIYNIGDSFESGKLGVAINSVEEKTEFTSDNQFIKNVTTEGKFVAVTAKLTNNDKEARTFSSTQFKLIDDKDRTFETLTSAELMMILGDQNLFLESCNPGMSRSGVFVFEIPSDVESYSIEVASGVGFAAGEKATVKLK